MTKQSSFYWLSSELELLSFDISIRFREETTREGLTVRNLGGMFDKWVPRVGFLDSSSYRPLKKGNGILIQLLYLRHQTPP